MKLTSVELHPAGSSDVCVLSFRDPTRQNSYNVRQIDGLDASEIVAGFYAGSGASKFYNLALTKRDITFRVVLNPNFSLSETYSSLREKLYKSIASSRTGLMQVQFKNGSSVIAAVSGFVTKLEGAHFDKSPEVQITITCSDPMLRALAPVAVDVSGLDPALTNIHDALSTAPHGFTFDIAISNTAASLGLSISGDSTWAFTVAPAGGFLTGDTLHFSSEYNGKALYMVRGGVTTYLADKIVSGSVWPIMFPGDNNFVWTHPTFVHWNAISYYPTYWGV